ncbi:MAG: uracil phosphoribosyltransferase [Chitinophagaceae bacterium]|jgi:uracil phosphoribosyltransferase|nr:uracil phosphoribosyltransferase [Chitinophagaceae bacterium]MCF8288615.1 uracil phosphoribosyltransferase [Chitinophagaceae bacterium]MCF8421612.1 uracil phosphoribosyltransferase [Chitinophagaceae bacterium]
MVIDLSKNNSLLNHWVAELRDVHVQNDRMRFRRNIERIGEVAAYELSKTLQFKPVEVTTPLGIAPTQLLKEQPVLATILRAGLPLHQGMLNYFDKADNAFISAYRKHHPDGSFEISLEYLSCPNLNDRVLILCDPMLATGASLVETIQAIQKTYTPAQIHIVVTIASQKGIEHVEKELGADTPIWCAAIDPILNDKSYIVPGLGDAGDLAFGTKMQS